MEPSAPRSSNGPSGVPLRNGTPVVLEIEVQGARQVRETMPEAVRIFIEPPDPAELRKRLQGRGTDAPEVIEQRLQEARKELRATEEFGHRVVNDDIERAANELAGIVRSSLDP